jgi:hypothetical protein
MKAASGFFARAAAVLALMCSGCDMPFDATKSVAGGGSDTETLTGLVALDGKPAVRVTVKLIPADYDPSRPDSASIRRAVTDDSGLFKFEKLDTAKAYNVIAGDPPRKSWAFASAVKAGAGRKALSLALAKVFAFSMHADNYQPADSGIAYFPGTDILTHCNGLTPSLIDSVPSGALHFIVASKAGWSHDTTLVSVGDTAKVSAAKSGLTFLP